MAVSSIYEIATGFPAMWRWVSHFISLRRQSRCENPAVIVPTSWLVVGVKWNKICQVQRLARGYGDAWSLVLTLVHGALIVTVRFLHPSDLVSCFRQFSKGDLTPLSMPLRFRTLSSVWMNRLAFTAPIYSWRKKESCQSNMGWSQRGREEGPLACLQGDPPGGRVLPVWGWATKLTIEGKKWPRVGGERLSAKKLDRRGRSEEINTNFLFKCIYWEGKESKTQ